MPHAILTRVKAAALPRPRWDDPPDLALYRCEIPQPGSGFCLEIEVTATNARHAKAQAEAEARRLYGYRALTFVR